MAYSAKTVLENLRKKTSSKEVKECFHDYKLEDKVEALKNYYGLRDRFNLVEENRWLQRQRKKVDTSGVKECLRPPVPSTFQTVIQDLRDTVRNAYWNKEIGKTIYLPPHLPAGCDPVETTFGKTLSRDEVFVEYGVSELINPKDAIVEDDSEVHELYRKTHNDYYPSEQLQRNYAPPFDKYSSFGDAKKRCDLSGKKMANCLQWCNPNPMTVADSKLADFLKRTQSPVGKVKNRDESLIHLTFGKNVDEPSENVADILIESALSPDHFFCSDYAENYSKSCVSSDAIVYRTAGIPSERKDLPWPAIPKNGAKADREHLGDETSVRALVSPSVFTQLGLSHYDFFKIREYDEMRSIFENIGVVFPGNSFDVIWNEGLKKDRTGGVCVETFRNLLARLALENFNNKLL